MKATYYPHYAKSASEYNIDKMKDLELCKENLVGLVKSLKLSMVTLFWCIVADFKCADGSIDNDKLKRPSSDE